MDQERDTAQPVIRPKPYSSEGSPSLPCPSCSASASKSHSALCHQPVSSKAPGLLQIIQVVLAEGARIMAGELQPSAGAREALSSLAPEPFRLYFKKRKALHTGFTLQRGHPAQHQEVLLGSGSHSSCHLSGSPSGSELYFICTVSAPASPAVIKALPAFPLYCLVNV